VTFGNDLVGIVGLIGVSAGLQPDIMVIEINKSVRGRSLFKRFHPE
jgi:hypothetical protein